MKKAVLVVDDPAGTLQPLADALDAASYDVTRILAPTTEEAVAPFSETPPEIVLVQLYQGGGSGVTLTEQIRQRADGAIVPILFFGSGMEMVTSVSDALAVGGDYYFQHPLDLDKVVGKIRAYIGVSEAAQTMEDEVTRPGAQPPGFVQVGRGDDHLEELELFGDTTDVSQPAPLNDLASLKEVEDDAKRRFVEEAMRAEQEAASRLGPAKAIVAEDIAEEAEQVSAAANQAEVARLQAELEAQAERERQTRAKQEKERQERDREEERRRAGEEAVKRERERRETEARLEEVARQEAERRRQEQEARARERDEQVRREAERARVDQENRARVEQAMRERAEIEARARRESEARVKAEAEERARADELKKRIEEETRRRLEIELKIEQEAAARKRLEEDARQKEAELKRLQEETRERERRIEAETRARVEEEAKKRDEEARRREAELRRQADERRLELERAKASRASEEDIKKRIELEVRQRLEGEVRTSLSRAEGEPAVQTLSLQPPSNTSGVLDSEDIATVLAGFVLQRITGRVRFLRGAIEKTVSFEGGKPVELVSNDAQDRLEDFLYREHFLTRAQYQACRLKQLPNPRQMGAAVIAEGYLKAQELFEVVRQHFEDALHTLFTWEDGTYSFEPVTAAPEDRIVLPSAPERLVALGIKRRYTLERLMGRLGGPSSLLVGLENPDTQLDRLGFDPKERAVAKLVDGAHSIEDMVFSTGLSEERVYQVLAALVAFNLAEVAVRGIEGPQAATGAAGIAIDRARIKEKYELAKKADYFEFLGLETKATEFEIERALQALRRAFAKERFPIDIGQELAEELKEIDRVLADAEYVLSDARLRDAYVQHMQRARQE